MRDKAYGDLLQEVINELDASRTGDFSQFMQKALNRPEGPLDGDIETRQIKPSGGEHGYRLQPAVVFSVKLILGSRKIKPQDVVGAFKPSKNILLINHRRLGQSFRLLFPERVVDKETFDNYGGPPKKM